LKPDDSSETLGVRARNWAKKWNYVIQAIGVGVGVAALIAAAFGGFLAYQQLVTANSQLAATTPSMRHFSGTWHGGQSVLSWQYNMTPYRTGTIYIDGTSGNFTASLRNAPQIEVDENTFGDRTASILTIIAIEGPAFTSCGYHFHLCSFLFLPIRITDPGLNINIKLACAYANATCGSIDFSGEVVFYP
jgi:hypothetical protein